MYRVHHPPHRRNTNQTKKPKTKNKSFIEFHISHKLLKLRHSTSSPTTSSSVQFSALKVECTSHPPWRETERRKKKQGGHRLDQSAAAATPPDRPEVEQLRYDTSTGPTGHREGGVPPHCPTTPLPMTVGVLRAEKRWKPWLLRRLAWTQFNRPPHGAAGNGSPFTLPACSC